MTSRVQGLGFSSYFGEDPDFAMLARNLDDAEALGMDFVELALCTMEVIANGRIIRSQLDRVRALTQSRSLKYTAHGPIAVNFLASSAIAARHMAVAKTTVEAAAELGAIHLILHTGTGSFENPASLEAAYEDQRQCFHTLGDFAVQHGVMLMVENIFTMTPQEHTALPSRLASEIAAIGHSHVAACLDFSHASLTSSMRGADFMQEINALAPFTRHLHIHDSFGEPFHLRTYSRAERVAYGLGDLHLPLGWGNLPWGEIMASLEFAPDVIFNLELPHLYAFALKDNVETMRGFRDAYAGRT